MSNHHTKNGSASSEPGVPAEILTAYALDQLSGPERDLVEQFLADPGQGAARELVADTRLLAAELPTAIPGHLPGGGSPALRERVLNQLNQDPTPTVDLAQTKTKSTIRRRSLSWRQWFVLGGIACVLLALLFPGTVAYRKSARRVAAQFSESRTSQSTANAKTASTADRPSSANQPSTQGQISSRPLATTSESLTQSNAPTVNSLVPEPEGKVHSFSVGETKLAAELTTAPDFDRLDDLITTNVAPKSWEKVPGGEPPITYPDPKAWKELAERRGGQQAQGQGRGRATSRMDLYDGSVSEGVRIVVVTDGRGLQELSKLQEGEGGFGSRTNTEQYAAISDNQFHSPLQAPLSTFSIDVDTASYANVRRFLTGGRLPPPDAVRIEELVNYFRYDYPQPKEGEAFSVTMESAECPWQPSHFLLRVGLKGKEIQTDKRPQSNLVFLLDVSGSMADEDKLPLLKTAMQMFTRELGENDRVSIVTYAGEAGLRLPPTRGHEQETIIAAIESLSSGGSTNGSAGIELAYEQAAAYFVPGGTNRVILCTDGDLNVGITDDESLVRLIKQKAAGGTFLTVLGFGEGNLKDAKMERLADNGNGLYAYIDSVREARKVLVEQMTGSTVTIAKDVKIQIEFNPAAIASYRLIGYENRVLAAEDFNDDTKDAGEIGAGHTVTALYELVPAGAEVKPLMPTAKVDPLKYQGVEDRGQWTEDRENESRNQPTLTDAAKSGELLTLKLRYKQPDGKESKLIEHTLKDRGGKFNAASKDLQFAAAVASFGMILRGSEHRGQGNLAAVSEIASGAIGEDQGGYRSEFLDLVRQAQALGAK